MAFAPETSPDLLGRRDEIEIALTALDEQGLLEISGPCGIGKTSLLHGIAQRAVAAFADLPVICASVAGQTLEDLLQTLFGLLYQPAVRLKPTHAQLRHELRRAQAVLLLDDVELGSEDLAELLRTVHDCRVAFTSPRRRLATEGRSLGLAGLDEQAGIQLMVRTLDRPLRHDEHTDVQQVWNLVAGHPLRLLQAAALLRHGDRTFADLSSALQSGDPADVLQQMCAAGLSTQQRMVVAVLAMASGTLLPPDLVRMMSSVSDHVAELRELCGRGVVEQRQDRYGLPRCSLGHPRRLIGPGFDQALALRSLAGWLEQPGEADLLSTSGAALTMLELAAEAGESKTVVRLVRALEPVLILSGRWQAWRHTLDQGVQAARALHQVVDEAHFLHQVGSGQLALDDPETAVRALDEALKLRKAHDTREAAAATRRNLTQARAEAGLDHDRRPSQRSDPRRWIRVTAATLSALGLAGLTVQAIASAVSSDEGTAADNAIASEPPTLGDASEIAPSPAPRASPDPWLLPDTSGPATPSTPPASSSWPPPPPPSQAPSPPQTTTPQTTIPIVSAPDLEPTAITFDDAALVVGNNVYFDSGIRNTDDADSGVFNIKWFVDGAEVGAYGSHEGVPAGATVLDGNSQFSWAFTSPGTYTVTFAVDVDDHVAEASEGNNSRSVTVTIHA